MECPFYAERLELSCVKAGMYLDNQSGHPIKLAGNLRATFDFPKIDGTFSPDRRESLR
jgi:hypothetical protein